MKQPTQDDLQKLHDGLAPAYLKHCRDAGVLNPPPVYWVSFHSPDKPPEYYAAILWDGSAPHLDDATDFFKVFHPGDCVWGTREEIAALAARKVVASMRKN